MTEQTVPMFREADLSELMNEGVLMAANEAFFWPIGLALTWDVPTHPADDAHWCGNERVHDAHTDEGAAWHGECGGTAAGTTASNLHVRQWEYEDGHHESIGLSPDDEVGVERRARWQAWLTERVMSIPPGPEQDRAAMVGSIVSAFLGPTPTPGS